MIEAARGNVVGNAYDKYGTRNPIARWLMKGFLDAEGMPLNHIKPHGALYGMAARSEEIANAICDAGEAFRVPLLGMARTKHEEVYTRRGFPFLAEFYVDLDYDKDGRLIITREHEAWDPQLAAKRTLRANRPAMRCTVPRNPRALAITRT